MSTMRDDVDYLSDGQPAPEAEVEWLREASRGMHNRHVAALEGGGYQYLTDSVMSDDTDPAEVPYSLMEAVYRLAHDLCTMDLEGAIELRTWQSASDLVRWALDN